MFSASQLKQNRKKKTINIRLILFFFRVNLEIHSINDLKIISASLMSPGSNPKGIPPTKSFKAVHSACQLYIKKKKKCGKETFKLVKKKKKAKETPPARTYFNSSALGALINIEIKASESSDICRLDPILFLSSIRAFRGSY